MKPTTCSTGAPATKTPSAPASRSWGQVKQVRAPWLVILGQNALVLYFVHQIIVLMLVRQRLGVVFTSWWLYALAIVALLVLLVGLGWLWPELKRRARQYLPARAEARASVARS